MSRELRLPEDFADYAWEVESKGVFWDVVVEYNGTSLEVTFYDPARLAQDVQEDVGSASLAALRRVLVIPAVTEAHMRSAVANASADFFS